MSERKYAIYGGTFDPVHNGHVSLAEHAVNECGIDKLIFMPAYVSPFKQDKKVSSGADRAAMIEKVLKVNQAFSLSRYELDHEGPSYTIETLEHWSRILDGELSFILGFDSMIQIDTWYRGSEILSGYHLITARRPDTDNCEGLARIEEFRLKYNADITILEMPPVDASSSEIRRRIAESISVRDLVDAEVEEYIIEHDLYR